MNPIAYFVPGSGLADEGILARLRWPIPTGVTIPYLQAYTRPGDLVLLPYCQGDAPVREALLADRRVLAVHFDPLLALILEVTLSPLSERELDAAVVRLGDSPKQGLPLRQVLLELYATTCPACLRRAFVDYFVWDREQEAPIAKYLRCSACSWDGSAAIEEEDRRRLASVPVEGMHYHFVLDRLAPEAPDPAVLGGVSRSRLQALLGLYSPRNLYALAELTLKIERYFPDGPPQRALKAMLLDCLDRCASLASLPDSPTSGRRRGLARPGRYIERNVWLAFEEAAARVRARGGLPVSGLVASIEELLALDEGPAGYVGHVLVRDLSRRLPPNSAGLILFSPPPLDFAAWSLSYLWSAWLLDSEAAAPLLPLVRQRTPDASWYARVMGGSMRALAALLRDKARIVVVLSGQRPELLEALCLAASQAQLGVSALLQRGSEVRLELSSTHQPLVDLLIPGAQSWGEPETVEPEGPATAAASGRAAIEEDIHAAVVGAAVLTIQQRGEPVSWNRLHAACLRHLAQRGLLYRVLQTSELPTDGRPVSALDLVGGQIQAGLDEPVFVQLPGPGGEQLWWLSAPPVADLALPLADRIEVAAHRTLQETLLLTEADLDAALCRQFPGPLTPDADLVAACLRSYGRQATGQPGDGYWQIREQDLSEGREAERQGMLDSLGQVGQRLNYDVVELEPFDLAWSASGRVLAVFAVRWQALLGEVLALGHAQGRPQPYLVIPGGRSALLSFKLAANPVCQESVESGGWRFVKYRHVRQLLERDDLDEYVWQTVVGLDPVVERESTQLSLL